MAETSDLTRPSGALTGNSTTLVLHVSGSWPTSGNTG